VARAQANAEPIVVGNDLVFVHATEKKSGKQLATCSTSYF
jgi:hypothetical protein